uniref:Ig-like domain-containing protein n=1 Tax=Lates calcarifer TaxID=8187 RepID=A0A4W6DLV7_LATCA
RKKMTFTVLQLLNLMFNVFFFTDENCEDKPVFTPSRLVVKNNDPTSATCSVKNVYDIFSLEKSLGNHTRNATEILWKVQKMTEWEMSPMCYYELADHQCCSKLPITVYKPPDSVSFSFRNHSGPLLEGHQYTLQCEVHNVAPVENLIVTFYRGQTALGQLQSNNTEKKPVTEIFTLNINTSKEDDGVQYWCEAKLELGPEGPQPPIVLSSHQRIRATVLCESDSKQTHTSVFSQEVKLIICLRQTKPITHNFFKKLSLVIMLASFISSRHVSISFRNHSGPLLEGHQYTLQCEVHNVAPVENLIVTFYRGQTAVGQLQSNNTEKKPVTEIFTLNINTRKEDDGVQYRCEAKLQLGPEGPQPPIVLSSHQRIRATVLCESDSKQTHTSVFSQEVKLFICMTPSTIYLIYTYSTLFFKLVSSLPQTITDSTTNVPLEDCTTLHLKIMFFHFVFLFLSLMRFL